MKVHSRHNSNNQKQRRIARVFLVAVLVVILGLLLPKIFTFAGSIVMYPIEVTQRWFGQSQARLPMFLKNQNELINRIADLESQLASAQGTDLTQQRLYDENLQFRELLGIKKGDRIAAAVIARPNELPYDLLQIDRGEQDGIKIGAPVYIGADNIVGVVSQTAPHYAFIQLFTTPGFTTTTFVSGANIVATLEGMGGGVARISVPQGIPLTVGDLVHVPSVDPGIFGKVAYLENKPSQPDQFGYITLQKPIASINYVAVGTEALSPGEPKVIEDRIANIIKQSLTIDLSKINLASTTVIKATTTASSTP